MKVAIPDWEGRVSPVFDVAATLLVADLSDGTVDNRELVGLAGGDVQARVRQLVDLGVDVLVCGAISWPLELALWNAGVEVFAQTCGEVDCILAAFADGTVRPDAFLMPGSCGRRRRFRHGGRRPGLEN